MMMWTSLIHFLLFQYVPTHTNAFLAQQRQPHRSTISTRTSTAVVVDQPLRPSLFATVERKSDSFSTNSDDFSGRRRQQQQVIIQHQTASTRPRVQPISSYATPTFHSAAQTQRLQQQQQQQQLSDSQNERNSYSYQEDTDINGANELANLRRRWAILDQRQQQQQSKLAAIRKNVIEISQRRQERWSASRAHTANISSGHVAHRSAVSPPNNTSYHSIQFSDPSSSTRHPQRVSANRHMQIPTIPRVGTTILPQQRTLSQSSPIAKTFLTECMSIDVAKPTDDKPIANLRAEVFGERVNGGHLESFKRKFVHRTCDFLHERRKMGTTCLTASINYMDANPWLVGSIECSTHEFAGTELGQTSRPGSVLYITEVAVSSRVRRSGVGQCLLKAMDKLATLRNVETLYLHVDTENLAALKLYFRNGFNLVDTKRGIYAEFTRKLNFHSDGNTMGRNYYLLKKDVQGSNTWC